MKQAKNYVKTLIQPNSQDKHIISLDTHHPFLLVDRVAVFSGLAIVHGVIRRPVGAGEQVCMGSEVYRVAFGRVLLAVSLFSLANAPTAQLPSSVTNPNIPLPTGSLSCLSEATASLRNHPQFFVFGASVRLK